MRARWALGCSIVVGFVLAAQIAQADLPRPPGWEPTCTLEKEQQKGGGPCDQARGWADPDPRQEAFAAKGYTRRCTEGGAGSFVAVWCKSAPDGTKPAEPATTSTAAATANPPATNATASPPPVAPVAPAADNRRGGGLCSVSSIGHDKPEDPTWAIGVLLLGLGFAARFGASRSSKKTQ